MCVLILSYGLLPMHSSFYFKGDLTHSLFIWNAARVLVSFKLLLMHHSLLTRRGSNVGGGRRLFVNARGGERWNEAASIKTVEMPLTGIRHVIFGWVESNMNESRMTRVKFGWVMAPYMNEHGRSMLCCAGMSFVSLRLSEPLTYYVWFFVFAP